MGVPGGAPVLISPKHLKQGAAVAKAVVAVAEEVVEDDSSSKKHKKKKASVASKLKAEKESNESLRQLVEDYQEELNVFRLQADQVSE
jgi:hypothetical protein